MPSKLTRTKEYKCWASIKERCLNENCKRFGSYGDRGIKICERWINSFTNFLEDMGYPPNENYSLDRIDNDGNYSPENCRWATWEQQYKNRKQHYFLKVRL